MVSVNPFRLSVQVISISCIPRAFKSVRTPIQKEELSDLPTRMPRTSFKPFVLFQTDAKVNGLIYDLAVIPYFKDNAVHPDYQVNRIKGTVLPLLGGLVYLVCNDGNGRCRELYFINLTHSSSMSETLIPLAYREMTSFSIESPRLSCLGTAIGSN